MSHAACQKSRRGFSKRKILFLVIPYTIAGLLQGTARLSERLLLQGLDVVVDLLELCGYLDALRTFFQTLAAYNAVVGLAHRGNGLVVGQKVFPSGTGVALLLL